MVVKVYVSGISGNKEVKKRQQRVLMILDSKTIKYEIIDIAEPGNESDKDFMQNNSKSNGGTVSDPNPRHALPPQLFNDEEYCGDYDQFDLANELDTLEQFLKVEAPSENNIEETTQDKNAGEKEEIKEEKNEEEKTAETSGEPEKEKPEDAQAVIENAPDGREVLINDGKPEQEARTKESIEADSNIVDEDNKVNVVENKVNKDDETQEMSSAAVQDEKSDERVKSEEREVVPEKVENNGVTSSREPSVEKKVTEPENTVLESLKDVDKSPSEALIESQKLAAE